MFLCAVALLFSLACNGDSSPMSPSPQQVEVQMQATTFSPADVSVAVGGSVLWRNSAAIAHTITPDNAAQAGVWVNQNVPAQTSFTFTHTFATTGTFNYTCLLHAGMTGVVRVQ
jgi:plastocyanin